MKVKTVVLAGLLPILAGCFSFNRDWKAAVREPLPQDDITGPWEGKWTSEENGHNDRLRCIIRPGSTNTYDARFRANYRKVLHFSYTVPLQAKRIDGAYAFSGQADLGKLAGGLYTYEGTATPTNYFSTYHSKYDHGTFEMHRPETK